MQVLTLNELRPLGAKLTKETFNPDAFTYVDLGLPSGRLWAMENAPSYYTFKEAVDTFGELLPKDSAMMELIEECKCTWNDDKKGLDVTGPNGNKIFLPAAGYTSESSGIQEKNVEGEYWTQMPNCQAFVRSLYFNADDLFPMSYYNHSNGFSVRFCKESH